MSKITRTVSVTSVDVLCADIEKEELFHLVESIPGSVEDNKTAFKCISKRFNPDSNIQPVAVKSCAVKGTLYGMEESHFLELATPAEKRGADTRGAVTKEVLFYEARCMVCTSDYKVIDKTLSLPRNMDNETAKRYLNRRATNGETVVTVKAVNEKSGLYFLPLDDFIKNAEILPERATTKETK